MTTTDQSQFTPSTASITLTWSASSGADNYTIMVTPLLPSGQSLVSTTTTSLQLTVLYNEEYSINITAQNCVGSNSRGGSAIFSVVRPRKWLCSHTSKSPLHNNKSFLQYVHNILKFTACVVRLYRLARAYFKCYHSLYQAIPFFARNDLYQLYHALFRCIV